MSEMTSEDMVEPVERLFEREFTARRSLFTELEDIQQENTYGDADLAYVQGGKDALHAVCMVDSYAESLTDVHSGIHASSSLKANFSWLVLPLDELRQGDSLCDGLLQELCEERGVGLLTVQPSGLGLSAKVIVSPRRQKGRYLSAYEGLLKKWKRSA